MRAAQWDICDLMGNILMEPQSFPGPEAYPLFGMSPVRTSEARSVVAVTKKIPRSKCFCKEKAEDAVVCEACGRWIHYNCVGLSAEKEYPYYCPQCSFGQLYTLEKDMKEIKNEMAHLRKENQELREQLGELSDMDPDSGD